MRGIVTGGHEGQSPAAGRARKGASGANSLPHEDSTATHTAAQNPCVAVLPCVTLLLLVTSSGTDQAWGPCPWASRKGTVRHHGGGAQSRLGLPPKLTK